MASVIDATTNLESENRSNSDDEATREKDLALELSNRRDEIGTIPEEVETSVEQNRYSALAAPRIPKSPGLSISIARKMHIEHDIQLPPSANPSATPNPLRSQVGVQSPSDCFDNLDETRDSFSDLGPNSYFASSSVIGEYSSDDATESVGSESPSRDAIHHHVFSPTSSEGGDQYSHVGKSLFGKLWKRQVPKAHHATEGGIYRSMSGDHLTSVLIPNPAPDSSTPEDSDQGILSPPSGRGSETEHSHSKSKHHHGHGLFDIFRHNRMETENSGHSLNRDSKARRKKSAEDSNTLKRNPHSSDQIKNFNHEDDHSYEQLKSRKNSKADSRNLFENIFHPDHHKRESSDDSSGSSSAIHHSGAHIHTHISQREFDEHKKKESVSRRSRRSASHHRNASDASLDKYGYKDTVIGKGGQATIRLIHKKDKDSKWYAVKEFRKRIHGESERDYVKKVYAEFCISSSLHHENIVETLDLVQDHHEKWCVVMEYCPGGDLLHKMMNEGFADVYEILCYFKQLLHGVSYIHENGVVHRDLKPENLIMDATKRVLKITDFGVAAVFRTQWEREGHLVHGKCGSAPYMPPEEWIQDMDYLPTKVDVWAVGMIFYSMLAKSLLWTCTKESDLHYATYLKKRANGGFPQFEVLDADNRELLYCLLDPVAANRYEAQVILDKQWVKDIRICKGEYSNHHSHL